MAYDTVASDEVIEKTKKALEANGFTVIVVDDEAAAKKTVLNIVPEGAEILTNTSATLGTLGLRQEFDESGKYDAIRPKLNAIYGDESKKREQRKLAASPDYTIGSAHAITEDGEVFIASNTGSQLPSYTYGASHVIWVVGTQKLVKDHTEAHKRLEEYVLPLESERARKAYGVDGSNISKLLIVSREVQPGRITIVLVKKPLGF